MEKEKNMTTFDVDALTDEELERYQNSIRQEQIARRKAQQEKALAERKQKQEELANARKERAKEVEDAFKAAHEAQKKADDLLDKFCKDYREGFHFTVRNEHPASLFDIFFQNFFNL